MGAKAIVDPATGEVHKLVTYAQLVTALGGAFAAGMSTKESSFAEKVWERLATNFPEDSVILDFSDQHMDDMEAVADKVKELSIGDLLRLFATAASEVVARYPGKTPLELATAALEAVPGAQEEALRRFGEPRDRV